METLLQRNAHPLKSAQKSFDLLLGIDNQKNSLLDSLELFFNKSKVDAWHNKHHKEQLAFLGDVTNSSYLAILAGDVGCGKTALVQSIGTPLSNRLDKRVISFETPSNIRGGGRVGEISNRITDAFNQAKTGLKADEVGILIIDEADDLATDRDQNQAHHEDRAGLNVLIKQIDLIAREKIPLAVILITNRFKVLDPAAIRRATDVIQFVRPDDEARKLIFRYLFNGSNVTADSINELVTASRKDVPYSFSDLIQKVGKKALFMAVQSDVPFSKEIYLEVLARTSPSPQIT